MVSLRSNAPLIRVLTVALLLALPGLARAWGPEGHQIVALIAYAHLTPEAKAGVKAILGDKDMYDAEVVNWADIIRRDNKDLGPYHYVDADVKKKAIDLKHDGENGKNVVDGVINQIAFLSGDATAPQIVVSGSDDATGDAATNGAAKKTETRGQALRWVIHLLGDIHQPLHTCDRNDDQGGNKVKVIFLGQQKETNLHAVWDGAMLRTYVNSYYQSHRRKDAAPKGDDGQAVPDITDYAMSLDAKVNATDRQAWTQGTPLDWANESHLIGVKNVYGDLPRGDPVPFDARYVAKKQQITERQLARGGVRLALVLNKIFATPTTRPAR